MISQNNHELSLSMLDFELIDDEIEHCPSTGSNIVIPDNLYNSLAIGTGSDLNTHLP